MNSTTIRPGVNDTQEIFAYHLWRQRVPFGNSGLVTPGHLMMPNEWKALGLPGNLNGKSFIEVGSNDGFFSFEAERRGAAQVTALDIYKNESDFISNTTGFPIRGITLLKKLKNSKINIVPGSILELDSLVTKHDIVLCNNVLTWVRDLPKALEQLTTIANETIYLGDVFSFHSKEHHIGQGFNKNILSMDAFKKNVENCGWQITNQVIFSGFSRFRWKNKTVLNVYTEKEISIYMTPFSVEPSAMKKIDKAQCQMFFGDFCFLREIGWVKKADLIFYKDQGGPLKRLKRALRESYLVDFIIWKLKYERTPEVSAMLVLKRSGV